MDTIREYGNATCKMSKTQQKQLDMLGTALGKYNAGAFHGEDNTSDLLHYQNALTDQLAKRLLTTDAHLKRAKRVGVKYIDPKSKSKLREYMRVSRKIFNRALDGHNKGISGEALRQRCIRAANTRTHTPAGLRQVQIFSSKLRQSRRPPDFHFQEEG